jgi:hypothetical protein
MMLWIGLGKLTSPQCTSNLIKLNHMIKWNWVSFQCNGKDEGHERIHWDG